MPAGAGRCGGRAAGPRGAKRGGRWPPRSRKQRPGSPDARRPPRPVPFPFLLFLVFGGNEGVQRGMSGCRPCPCGRGELVKRCQGGCCVGAVVGGVVGRVWWRGLRPGWERGYRIVTVVGA